MPLNYPKNFNNAGFTILQMSIVLVLIGLIIGGILVGQDLVRAAAERAQITQLNQYNAAVNTFVGKYNALPGDMNAKLAQRLGFTYRSGTPANGDGNGVIEAYWTTGPLISGLGQGANEKALFWIDLTTANGMNLNLIPGSFSSINASFWPTSEEGGTDIVNPAIIAQYLPLAKIGHGSSVSVISWNGMNYFNVSNIAFIAGNTAVTSYSSVTVKEAYDIDKKIDDGLPQSGMVTDQFNADTCCWLPAGVPTWAAGNTSKWGPYGAAPGISYIANQSTCYDNGGSSSKAMQYSIGFNNGSGLNCALLVQFQ